VKLDASIVEAEFMCNLNNQALSKPIHLMLKPMLAICCGHSACYDCFKEYLAQDEKHFFKCPFSGCDWPNGKPLLTHNRWMHQLIETELPKDTNRLSEA
jgi:hypothetical protein